MHAAPAVATSALAKGPKGKDQPSGSKPNLPCYAHRRSNCHVGAKCKKEHRALTAEEIKKRDEQEASYKKKGKGALWPSKGNNSNKKGHDKAKGNGNKGHEKTKGVKFYPSIAKKGVPCRYIGIPEGCKMG